MWGLWWWWDDEEMEIHFKKKSFVKAKHDDLYLKSLQQND